jgi:hypothetical protein
MTNRAELADPAVRQNHNQPSRHTHRVGDPREVGPRAESHSVTGADRRRSRRHA